VGIQRRRVEQNGRLPGGLLQGLGHVLHHLASIFVEYRVVFYDQGAVAVLLQDGHELKDVKLVGSPASQGLSPDDLRMLINRLRLYRVLQDVRD